MSDSPRTDAAISAPLVDELNIACLPNLRAFISFARQLEREIAEKQADIDALMLEYCPEDMTPEQIENWSKHQKAAPESRY